MESVGTPERMTYASLGVPLEHEGEESDAARRQARQHQFEPKVLFIARAATLLAIIGAVALGWSAVARTSLRVEQLRGAQGGHRPYYMGPLGKAPLGMKFEIFNGVKVAMKNGTAENETVDWILQFPPDTSNGFLKIWGANNGTIATGLDKINGFLGNQSLGKVMYRGHPSGRGLPIIIYRATPKALKLALKYFHNVSFAEESIPMRKIPELKTEKVDVKYGGDGYWNLGFLNNPEAPGVTKYDTYGATGAGTHIYILDTGVRTTHEDFEGRAIPTLDATSYDLKECDPSDTSCADDWHGHGTHCASIAGGKSSGVARGATLHAVQVFAKDGKGGSTIHLAQAMDWILQHGERPAVVSMSLGGSGFSTAMESAVEKLGEEGIVVVVAAGNEGETEEPDACNYYPAHAGHALTVGSVDEKMHRSKFSNVGKCIDLFAPGSTIKAAGHEGDSLYMVMSGTSMACPHVSGATALAMSTMESTQDVTSGVIHDMIVEASLDGKIPDPGPGSPNKLLNVEFLKDLEFDGKTGSSGSGDVFGASSSRASTTSARPSTTAPPTAPTTSQTAPWGSIWGSGPSDGSGSSSDQCCLYLLGFPCTDTKQFWCTFPSKRL